MQTEDGHYQAPKHVAVPYVENTLYSINTVVLDEYTHTYISYISYFIEHNGDDEPHDKTSRFDLQTVT